MSDLVVKKSGLPFVLGGATELNVRVGELNPLSPLPDGVAQAFQVSATGGGTYPLDIGGAGSATISLKAGSSAALRVIRPGSQLATDYGLAPFFQQKPDQLALFLDVGANADGTFGATSRYSGLTAGATLQAGAQARFGYVNAYPKATAVADLIPAFFSQVRVPALMRDTPGPGEVSRLEFGGYLKLGLQLGAGYTIKGTPSLQLGALQLSERYDLSVIGTVGLNAEVSGVFSVEVRGATDAAGRPADNWARVIVKRSRSDTFAIAGDVKVNPTSQLTGLPESPDELLGALLGVGVKNWLHVLERVTTLSDPVQFKAELDALSKRFITEWTGQAAEALDKEGLGAVLARVKQVVDQYNGLENTVITAFDRYYNQLTSPALGGRIAKAIEDIANLPAWTSLNGQIDPMVWRLVTELTDGDPLSWMLTKSVGALQARARQLLDLGSNTAHTEIRSVIKLVKDSFGVSPLFAELDTVDTIPKLKAQANTRAGAFVQRLTGTAVDDLVQGDAEKLLAKVHLVLTNARTFEATAYAKCTAALAQTASFNLHAEYSRASTDDAFVDIALNVGTPEGRQLLQECALGDFSRALGGNRQDLVRINDGRLVHRVVKERAVAVTVVGWQKAFSYSSIDRLVIEADQRLVTESNGGVTAYTTLSIEKVRDVKRNGERTLTNLMLRFVGESSGVLTSSQESKQFLVDAITGMAARYQLTYEDQKTTAKELAYYVSFAKTIGLDQPALQPAALGVLLPLAGPDNFGSTSAQYDVRYTEDGLQALFKEPFQEGSTRDTMRKVVLASYLRQGGELANVGWAYWTSGVYDLWRAGQAGFVKPSTQEYSGITSSPFSETAAPPYVQIGREPQELLSTLYYIEDDLVAGFRALHDLVSQGTRISPVQFERALTSFGNALDAIDRFAASENGAFAVFDDLQRRAAPAAPRLSSLTLTSQVAATPVSKVFLPPTA